jgi:SAM-dependent methyltransferase
MHEASSIAKRWIPNAVYVRGRKTLRSARRWLHCHPLHTERGRRAAEQGLGAADRELLRKVSGKIALADTMYTGDTRHYYRSGLSALHCIEAAVRASGQKSIRSILDIPCGCGRVLRFLKVRFPEARITACDLDRAGVDFCADTFGAIPVYSKANFDELALTERFDLVWCGSLVTHLDAAAIDGLLAFLARHLAPGGIVVFTSSGDGVLERMRSGRSRYGLTRQQIDELLERHSSSGFGYADYPGRSGYGISVTSREWIEGRVALSGLAPILFERRGWNDHQDVHAFSARP